MGGTGRRGAGRGRGGGGPERGGLGQGGPGRGGPGRERGSGRPAGWLAVGVGGRVAGGGRAGRAGRSQIFAQLITEPLRGKELSWTD